MKALADSYVDWRIHWRDCIACVPKDVYFMKSLCQSGRKLYQQTVQNTTLDTHGWGIEKAEALGIKHYSMRADK